MPTDPPSQRTVRSNEKERRREVPGELNGLQRTSLWGLEDDGAEGATRVTEAAQVAVSHAIGGQRLEQPPGEIDSDGTVGTYSYTGYVLEGRGYVRKTLRFTCEEAGVYASEPSWRVCAMLDLVGRDEARQEEIRKFGKRVWHSPYRPEGAALQGLDYIFRHDVELVSACHPSAVPFYAAERERVDRWTGAMYDAYKAYLLLREGAALRRLLAEAAIPPALMGINDEEVL